ncbi:MAG: HAD family hydrolase [Thermodesulfobacteriota bacterium]|nr:HAD family hydrolase [Thermodesulfobacteriota bacterium]
MRAVFFDMDGTLLDTIEDIARSMNHVLHDLGFPIHDIGQYKLFVGNGMEMLVERAIGLSPDTDIWTSAMQMMEKRYAGHCMDRTVPYPGIMEMLDALWSRDVRTAVLSNKPDLFTKKMADRFFGASGFDLVRGTIEGIPHKPNPAAALDMASRMGIAPEEIVFVGDTGVDMATARSAGMYPAGVLWGFRDKDELVSNGAKTLVKAPSELLDLVLSRS